jgi:hypothetical protein
MPQIEAPLRFVSTLEQFIAETEPADFTRDEWQAMLRKREEAA